MMTHMTTPALRNLPPPARATEPVAAPHVGVPVVEVAELSHRYGARQALASLDLTIGRGEIFAILGPNGGGKTTLFRVLSTLASLQQGTARIAGYDVAAQPAEVRARIGVVFQAPSLDRKLTVAENIDLQGTLYGLPRQEIVRRRNELMDQFGIGDRARDLTEKLSGGLRRRVELAKGLIHRPELLLLDEPSTGLDPAARSDLSQLLKALATGSRTTVVLTTHLLDEADAADRIAILNQGQLVALGRPDDLRAEVGGDSISLQSTQPRVLADEIERRFGHAARLLDGEVRLEVADGHQWIARLFEAFPGQIAAVRLGKPTLEDVFIARTGHRFFWRESPEAE
jgi:ABC-2 type transport system ATP-binding protein